MGAENFAHRQRNACPTDAKPVVALKTSAERWIVRVKLLYGTGKVKNRADYAEYEMYDMGPYQSISKAWALNSIRAMRDGVSRQLANFTFEKSGSVSDSGLEPSTFEFAFRLGKADAEVTDANFPWVGMGHGHMGFVGANIYLNGSGAVDYNLDANAPVGTVLYGTAFSFQSVYHLLAPDGAILARTTLSHTFGATEQCVVDWTHDFSHPDVTSAARIWNSYCAMLPATGFTQIKPNGSTPVTISDTPGTQTNHGEHTLFTGSRGDDVLCEMVLRLGCPVRINGVDDHWGHVFNGSASLTIDQAYGSKTYVPAFAYSGTTTELISGTVRGSQAYKVRIGEPA